ncbi:MAG TPA: DUF4232 domain-containing protein [Corynebacterium kroppenstedtii]|nr:DUF4232 domain-containing protein [Corynebacterium kroppenstedtii]
MNHSPKPQRHARSHGSARRCVLARRGAVFAALTVSACVLAACGSGTSSTNTGSESTVPSVSSQAQGIPSESSAAPSPSLSGSSTVGPSTKNGSEPNDAAAHNAAGAASTGRDDRCHTADIAASLKTESGAAGSSYLTITLTNQSDHSCTFYGYPGVSAVGGNDGHQIGKPADKDRNATASLVTVAPGEAATVTVKKAQAGSYSPKSCKPQQARGLRIYPPDEKAALFVDYPTDACSGDTVDMHVGPITKK